MQYFQNSGVGTPEGAQWSASGGCDGLRMEYEHKCTFVIPSERHYNKHNNTTLMSTESTIKPKNLFFSQTGFNLLAKTCVRCTIEDKWLSKKNKILYFNFFVPF